VYSGAYKSNDPCGDAAISGRILNRLARSSGMSVKIQPVPECGRALPTEGSSFAISQAVSCLPLSEKSCLHRTDRRPLGGLMENRKVQ